MKVTKLGHCCLLIEENNKKILTDPGNYSVSQNDVTGIDIVLITHEHQDHLHIDSLEAVMANNPEAKIITNTAVAKLLDEAEIAYTLIAHNEAITLETIVIEAFEAKHAEMHSEWPRILNSGFFIANKLFYPGDALIDPERQVEILALPVAGPWIKIGEAVDYALSLKPKHAFPVHDGGLKQPGVAHRLPELVLTKHNINFAVIDAGETKEY
jgi:L-ascorbate metabolism protein UlaG (beta-lactamase superfamily)